MKKTSNLFIGVILSFSLVACNTFTSNTNLQENNVLFDLSDNNAKKGNIFLKIDNPEKIFQRFKTKSVDFNNSLIKKIGLTVAGFGINSPITAIQNWTPGNSVDFNLLVPAGNNRIMTLSGLDENNNPVASMMGAINVIANQNNVGTISYFETAIAQTLLNIINSTNSGVINNVSLDALRNYIQLVTGYNTDNNTFSKLNPALLDVFLIANYIIAHNGALPPDILQNLLSIGSVKVKLNVTGANIYINDTNSESVLTSLTETTVNNVSSGYWDLTVTKNGYKSKTVKINVTTNATTNVDIILEPIVVSTPTPTPTPTPTKTASPTPTPTTTNVPIGTGKIVFNSSRTEGIGLFIINSDGSINKVVNGGSSAVLSPDGNKIAYETANDELYVINKDGTGSIKLSTNTTHDGNISWSPDSNKIAFLSNKSNVNIYEIYTVSIDGTNLTRITNANGGEGYFNPRWSPDGSKIAFMQPTNGINYNISVINTDGTNKQLVTTVKRWTCYPNWTPDSSKIIFSSADLGDIFSETASIYKINLDGTNKIRLTNSGFADENPVLSPDGTKIAFTSQRDQVNLTSNGSIPELYVMNSDGTNQTRLTNNKTSEANPKWSPDSTKIAFTFNDFTNPEIYIINADGTNLLNITNNPSYDGNGDWSK